MLLEKFPGDEDDMPWDFALLEPDQVSSLWMSCQGPLCMKTAVLQMISTSVGSRYNDCTFSVQPATH